MQSKPVSGLNDSAMEPTGKQTAEKSDEKKSGAEVTEEEKSSLLNKVNKELLVPKLSFFFFFMATGAFLPYLGVYYKQLWLNARESGILLGIRPFIKMLCSPLWGVITDVCQKPKVILLLSIFGSIIAHWSQSIVSPFNLPCYPENMTTPNYPQGSNTSSVALSAFKMNSIEKGAETTIGVIGPDLKKSRDRAYVVSPPSNDEYFETSERTSARAREGTAGRLQNTNPFSRLEIFQRDFAGTAEEYGSVFRRDTRGLSRNEEEESRAAQEILAQPRGLIIKNKRKKSPKPPDDFRVRDNAKIFVTLLVIVIMGETVAAPAPMLTDSGTLSLLTGKEHEYGKQRLFGSLGWGAGALVAGFVVTAFHSCQYSDNINYVPVFYVFALAMFLNFVVTLFFRFKSGGEKSAWDKSYTEGLKVFCNVKNASFIFVLLFLGFSHSLQLSFLFWFLQDIGGTPMLFTMVMLVNSLSEVFMFLWSTYAVQRIGNDGMLYVGLGCYGVRFLFYSYIEQPWYVLPLEILQGATYGGVWTASVSYVPPNPAYSATVQGIIHGVYWGLGMAIGGVLGGVLVHTYGARITFRMEAACAFAILVSFFVLNRVYYRRMDNRYQQVPTRETEENGAATKATN
ncbi:predicted protein [Nematostella vectensis]|uniref:Major facilitator superfamily (MFS) profile domain-containing protein n=1 Tax=Nematostella vectensis TaxID=45351 RepID=A7SEM6_NEMVE|nr:predicted protein [Nematostella vectensis]|eukprot:XP_001629902.1 predicted protein [Nematostella vectensis]